ncbi:MAG: [protein-PII] uridylyltransferase [Candidatus Azotimanducaceae bacterium]|jgi:[protein-PII] uridylyltransferase
MASKTTQVTPVSGLLSKLKQELQSCAQVVPVFKQALLDNKSSIEKGFYQGTPVEALIIERSTLVSGVLKLAWQQFDWQESLTRWRPARIALLAVGGFGRNELLPRSDIDLLILLERDNYSANSDNIQQFLALLWDVGLEVGHSVRSIQECRVQAELDVTVVTAMLEARTLCGDEELREKMRERISIKKIWPAKKFFKAKVAEQHERHRKSEYTEYSLEPDVKSSPGGLRDIQTIMWIANRHFGVEKFSDLVKQKILTASERKQLSESQSLLWKIRCGLHILSGRDDNRLLFEYQRELATIFGYKDSDQLAVEQFMQVYYRSAMEVRANNDLILQSFEEVIFGTNEKKRIVVINERFQLCNNYIEIVDPAVFRKTPSALLEMFVIMGNNPRIEGVRASTIRQIRTSLQYIDEDFRNNPINTAMFLGLLRSAEHLFSQLRRMADYGILSAYLPEFGRIIGQMQFDLFHVYTVDAHTLQVVRNMRRFRYKNQQQKFPIAAHIHPRLPKVELLYIAGLYHDIAKGQGGDHSELGIGVAKQFCKRHGLGDWDTKLVCWLVENHLTMSSTAQRKDTTDPEVIHEFAELVQDQVHLDYLYALTVADINATNPTLWNSWRASLMRQLYVSTKRMLRHGMEASTSRTEFAQEARTHAVERLIEHGITKETVDQLWTKIDLDYFIRESVADIVWHTIAIAEHDLSEGPLVIIRNDISSRITEGATHLFVYGDESISPFAASVSAFDKLRLNVVDARIANSANGVVFDSFVVLEADGKMVAEDSTRVSEIESVLKKYLTDHSQFKKNSTRRASRRHKQFSFRPDVSLTNEENQNYSVLEVVTPDRPGLLSIIAQIFLDLDIELQSAKITTLGERVEDLFYITDTHGQPVKDPKLTEALISRIENELDNFVQKASETLPAARKSKQAG